MTRRVCACGCGTDISDRRSDCVWASDACRMAVQRGQRRRRPNIVRTGARKPTRYGIFKLTLHGLTEKGFIEAHDRESAIRDVVGAPAYRRDRFVAIPERMLRSYLNDGKPAA